MRKRIAKTSHNYLFYLVVEMDFHMKACQKKTRWWSEHVSGAERWEFPLPAHVGVRSPAPPLKVTADRSAHFRSPLTYNFIPLRWNRSKLAHILNSSACLTPAVFNRSLGTHCLRDGRGAGLLRNCCGKIRFTSILSRGRGCGVFGPRLIRAYSAGSVAALIC